MTPLWSLHSARSSSYCTPHDTGIGLTNIRKSPTAANLAVPSQQAHCSVHGPCESTWTPFQADNRTLLFDLRHFTVSKDVEIEIMQVAAEAQGALVKS